MGEVEFEFFFEVGNFDYVVGVVGGVEDGKFTGLNVDAVVALKYIAIDADLKGVMPEGGVGDAADWGEGGFVVSAGDYGASVFNDFVGALPVVYGECAIGKVEEVKSAGYAHFFVVYGPFGTVGVESVLVAELLEEAECFVGFLGLAEIVMFNLGVE